MTYVVDNPEVTYADQNTAWRKFASLFAPLETLLFYLPVFREYYPAVLKTFLKDNVQHLEIRYMIKEVCYVKFYFVLIYLTHWLETYSWEFITLK